MDFMLHTSLFGPYHSNVATGGKNLQGTKMAPVASAYAVLMNARSDKVSAWHRKTAIVAINGHREDSVSVSIRNHKTLNDKKKS